MARRPRRLNELIADLGRAAAEALSYECIELLGSPAVAHFRYIQRGA